LRQIAQNAGVEGAIVVSRVKAGKDDFGYNAATDHYGRLIAMGVIDPVKVVRTALQNAASVAGLMLTTECLIAERPKGKQGERRGPRRAKRFLGDLRESVACAICTRPEPVGSEGGEGPPQSPCVNISFRAVLPRIASPPRVLASSAPSPTTAPQRAEPTIDVSRLSSNRNSRYDAFAIFKRWHAGVVMFPLMRRLGEHGRSVKSSCYARKKNLGGMSVWIRLRNVPIYLQL